MTHRQNAYPCVFDSSIVILPPQQHRSFMSNTRRCANGRRTARPSRPTHRACEARSRHHEQDEDICRPSSSQVKAGGHGIRPWHTYASNRWQTQSRSTDKASHTHDVGCEAVSPRRTAIQARKGWTGDGS